MKKIFTIMFALVVGISVMTVAPVQTADAQPVVMSNRCCDMYNVARCIQSNYTPIGATCLCYGQGYGHTC